MIPYSAPVADMRFVLNRVVGIDRIAALPKRSPAEIARALEAVSRAVQLSQSGVVNLYPRTLVLDGLRMELAG